MAINTRQRRMSAVHPASPWRGPMVDASEAGFSQDHRRAAAFLYSGITTAPPGQPKFPGGVSISRVGPGGVSVSKVGPGGASVSKRVS